LKKYLYFAALGLLFLAGLVNLFPNTLTPIFELGLGMITIQRILGLISVVLAIYLMVVPERE